MPLPIKTKRWNDPTARDDGLRVLVSRYRPRALPKTAETWDVWCRELGPSAQLHAEVYGKHGPPISWEVYRKRYVREMRAQENLIGALVREILAGRRLTLLCSSACTDPRRCHRTLLARLIEERLAITPGRRARPAHPWQSPE